MRIFNKEDGIHTQSSRRKDKNKKDFELDDDGAIYQLDSHWKIQ